MERLAEALPAPLLRPAIMPPERVNAERLEHVFKEGRNKAVVIACRAADGRPVSCVVKLKARMCSSLGGNTYPLCNLVEWLAAAVGPEFGVCVPQPFEVIIGKTFIEFCDDPQVRSQALNSQGSAFGSLYMQGAEPLVRGRELRTEQRVPASRLLLFDIFVQNADRRDNNANLFVSRDDYIAYDHGEAFSFLSPFVLSLGDVALDPLVSVVLGHALFRPLKGRLDTHGFLLSLAGLTDDRLEAIGAATPAVWQESYAAGKLLQALDVMKRRRDGVGQWLPQVIKALT